MSIPRPPRIRTDAPLQTVQDNIASVVDQLVALPLTDGVLVSATAIAATPTDTYVAHKLGRTPRGWFVISPNAAATVYTSPTTNPDATRLLILRASAAVTAQLWVF